MLFKKYHWSNLGEWLGRLLAVLGLDDSSLQLQVSAEKIDLSYKMLESMYFRKGTFQFLSCYQFEEYF